MAMVSKVGQRQLRNRTVRQRAWVRLPELVRLGREMVAGRHAGFAGDGFGGLEGSLPAEVSEWPGSVAVLGRRPIAPSATFSTRERETGRARPSGSWRRPGPGIASRHYVSVLARHTPHGEEQGERGAGGGCSSAAGQDAGSATKCPRSGPGGSDRVGASDSSFGAGGPARSAKNGKARFCLPVQFGLVAAGRVVPAEDSDAPGVTRQGFAAGSGRPGPLRSVGRGCRR